MKKKKKNIWKIYVKMILLILMKKSLKKLNKHNYKNKLRMKQIIQIIHNLMKQNVIFLLLKYQKII